MASVIQCDICGKVYKPEDGTYLKLFSVTKANSLKSEIYCKDLCTTCFKKVCRVLELEVPNAYK